MNEKFQGEIRKIRVDAATFKDTNTSISPTYINYFFGNNGTGKSTIAKAINPGLVLNILLEDLHQTTKYWSSTRNT